MQLFVKRLKVSSGSAKQALQQLDANFMSDEEDGEGSQEGSWVVRSPQWRSPRLTTMLRELQSRVDSQPFTSKHPRNIRVQGTPSTRHPPSSPAWALTSETHRRSPVPRSPSPQPNPPSPQSSQSSLISGSDDDEDEDEVWHGLDENPVAAQKPRRVRQITD